MQTLVMYSGVPGTPSVSGPHATVYQRVLYQMLDGLDWRVPPLLDLHDDEMIWNQVEVDFPIQNTRSFSFQESDSHVLSGWYRHFGPKLGLCGGLESSMSLFRAAH